MEDISVSAAAFLTRDEAMRYIADKITEYVDINLFVITARGSSTLEHADAYLKEAQPTLGVDDADIHLLELRDEGIAQQQMGDLRSKIQGNPSPRRVVLGKAFPELCPSFFLVGSGGSYTAAIIQRELAPEDDNARLFSMIGSGPRPGKLTEALGLELEFAPGACVVCIDLETDAPNLTTEEYKRLKQSIERGDDDTSEITHGITRKMREEKSSSMGSRFLGR
jgi:hypothetical protein